jgi:hypothetical protein
LKVATCLALKEIGMDETSSISSTVDFERGIQTQSVTLSGERVIGAIHNERELIELGKRYKLLVNYNDSDVKVQQTAAEILKRKSNVHYIELVAPRADVERAKPSRSEYMIKLTDYANEWRRKFSTIGDDIERINTAAGKLGGPMPDALMIKLFSLRSAIAETERFLADPAKWPQLYEGPVCSACFLRYEAGATKCADCGNPTFGGRKRSRKSRGSRKSRKSRKSRRFTRR